MRKTTLPGVRLRRSNEKKRRFAEVRAGIVSRTSQVASSGGKFPFRSRTRSLTTSPLRNSFGAVTSIESNERDWAGTL